MIAWLACWRSSSRSMGRSNRRCSRRSVKNGRHPESRSVTVAAPDPRFWSGHRPLPGGWESAGLPGQSLGASDPGRDSRGRPRRDGAWRTAGRSLESRAEGSRFSARGARGPWSQGGATAGGGPLVGYRRRPGPGPCRGGGRSPCPHRRPRGSRASRGAAPGSLDPYALTAGSSSPRLPLNVYSLAKNVYASGGRSISLAREGQFHGREMSSQAKEIDLPVRVGEWTWQKLSSPAGEGSLSSPGRCMQDKKMCMKRASRSCTVREMCFQGRELSSQHREGQFHGREGHLRDRESGKRAHGRPGPALERERPACGTLGLCETGLPGWCAQGWAPLRGPWLLVGSYLVAGAAGTVVGWGAVVASTAGGGVVVGGGVGGGGVGL